MNPEKFTDAEKLSLASLDFDRYTDPVAKSIGDWHKASDDWNNRLRVVKRGDNTYEQACTDSRLIGYENLYVDAFFDAAHQVAADSPIEENAIKTLNDLVRTEEARRIKRIADWYEHDLIEPSSDDYFRDIVMAFADPKGHTLTPDKKSKIGEVEEFVLSPDIAKELYRAHIRKHSLVILKDKPREATDLVRIENRRAKRIQRSLGILAVSAFIGIAKSVLKKFKE
ncbi:hypothetical protein KC953_02720 [Candidatus Saccharibacteria bacterium]|nr:hypothetical protein [Candidatus Saccharibacteria bacterium]